MCQVVRLYNVVEIVLMSGKVAYCSVVCGTLVGVFGIFVTCRMQYAMSVSTVL